MYSRTAYFGRYWPALFILLYFFQSGTAQTVVINEYSAANISGLATNEGDHPDWIELYNTTNASINLTGYYLSDKIDNPTKWQIPPGVIIAAHNHQLFLASSQDEISFSGIHTNFKLTQSRQEYIVLSDPAGQPVDIIQLAEPTRHNHARGRLIDGAAEWGITDQPSPNQSNTNYKNHYTDAPVFSETAGFYSSEIQISIFAADNITIRYTLDGSQPNALSPIYTTPVSIAETTVVKARSFSDDPNVLPGFCTVNTYFINEHHSLPVISVSSAEVATLMEGEDWEENYLTYTEYFENQVRQFELLGHSRSHGNDSWNLSQRGIRFYARDDYGSNHQINYPLFPSSDREAYDVFILKASASDNFPNAALQWERPACHLRDAYIQTLSDRANLHLDERRYRRCVLYVNGQYWGLYEMRERLDADYTKYYHNQGEKWVDMLEYWGGLTSRYGAVDDWLNLYDFIINNDLAQEQNYQYVAGQLDISSLIDYVILNTYTVNTDWLNWNTKWWRGRKGDGVKWRYCLWDLDNIFGLGQNYSNLPDVSSQADPCDVEEVFGGLNNPEIGHIEILLELFENPTFFQQYASRYADLTATAFSCENMLGLLDEMVAEIEGEMPRQVQRWGGDMEDWYANLNTLRQEISNKCTIIVDQVVDCYEDQGLTGPFPLVLEVFPPGSGQVQINSATGTNYPWQLSYMGGVETNLVALPDSGFNFINWEVKHHHTSDTLENTIRLNLETGDTIIANFEQSGCSVFTEINGPDTICNGMFFSLQVNGSYESYQWSDGSTAARMMATTGGTYAVTVTDEQGCYGRAVFAVQEFSAPDLQISGASNICKGQSLQIAASQGFVNYEWSDGSSGEQITVTESGSYEVSVTNENGCIQTAATFVEMNPVIDFDAVIQDESCDHLSDGNILLNIISGTAPYEVNWSNNSTGTYLENLASGDYVFEIIDAANCNLFGSLTVNAPLPILPNVSTTGTHDQDGTAMANPSGGQGPYSIQWSTGASGIIAEGLSRGSYTVTVTDAQGCTGAADFFVDFPTSTALIETVNTLSIFPNPAAADFFIQLELERPEPVVLEIFNDLGQVVYQEKMTGDNFNKKINTENLTSGVHWIVFHIGHSPQVKTMLRRIVIL